MKRFATKWFLPVTAVAATLVVGCSENAPDRQSGGGRSGPGGAGSNMDNRVGPNSSGGTNPGGAASPAPAGGTNPGGNTTPKGGDGTGSR